MNSQLKTWSVPVFARFCYPLEARLAARIAATHIHAVEQQHLKVDIVIERLDTDGILRQASTEIIMTGKGFAACNG